MIISELSYCGEITEFPTISGSSGACSLTVQWVNGEPTAESKGCPLTKKVIKKGGITTYIFEAGNNQVSLSSDGNNTQSSWQTSYMNGF
ncbi:hypothetical protein H6G17_25895 [Chroococcidiopsis sp. FACHB-1243]|uniref:hypothetical protein n=1 Tax=Chroococcidiopsis sp. [FACHB-1243] TaxID=2692781 RepID=UPI00177FBF0C|nr:hypothetical protein [Chroococcidiopsis sp. [FACHB-1243]]MBD2308904.1 hypothetical protein [Chroococcidiopsis sp. [FACHB-1243]]